jgi:hypothetical protein
MVILFAIVWWGQSLHFLVPSTQNRRVGCARDQAFILQCAIDQFPMLLPVPAARTILTVEVKATHVGRLARVPRVLRF